MQRRYFLKLSALAALLPCTASAGTGKPQVAITLDDPHTGITPLFTAAERDERIRAILAKRRLEAALFVCGKRVSDEAGKSLLKAWDRDGHIIANHSYSHLYYHSAKVDFETFRDDLVKGEDVVRHLERFRRLFRFPYLKEGNTVEKRDGMRAFLDEHGYRNGHVTIDASDWYVDDRLRKRLAGSPDADITGYRDYYLTHMLDRATYYNDLAIALLGRPVKHTLLIHHSLLNALFLGDLLKMFERNGWKLIDASEAFSDPLFSARPDVLPAGESIIWSLAKESGRFKERLRYPAEDGEYEKEGMDASGL